MQNCIDPVTARRRHAETVTYCWKHSEHATVHQPSQGDAGLRTVNNNRMSGTHLHDGSSRTSTTIRHPQDASDTHCQYRHPKDASNHADGKAVRKQQAFANTHGVLAKNPANLYKATAIESHQYDADTYANAYGDDSHNIHRMPVINTAKKSSSRASTQRKLVAVQVHGQKPWQHHE